MKALIRSNDPVELSFLQALLADAGIESLILDAYTSVMEGSIGAIPRRLAVLDEDHVPAVRILREAGFVPERGP